MANWRLGSGAAALLLLAATARADVTLSYHITSAGYRGMGSSSSDQKRMVKGMRFRQEETTRMTGAVLGKVTHDRERVSLTLLDKEVIDHLNVPKKTYEEISLREAKSLHKTETRDEKTQAKEEPPTHRITQAKFSVTPTNERKTINGFPCQKYLLEMLLEVEDLKTHERSQTRMLNTLWTTPETDVLKTAQREEQAFSDAYLRKLGVTVNPRDMETMGGAIIGAVTGAGEKALADSLSRLPSELKKIKGYPVLTLVEWYGSDANSSSSAASSVEAADDSSVDLSGGVGGALGGLASNWAKKKVNKKMEERAAANAGKPVYAVTSELRAVSVAPLAESLFDVPAGFRKVSP